MIDKLIEIGRCYGMEMNVEKTRVHKKQYYNEIFIILTGDFSQELYVLPDDDKRYAIETCRSSVKCFKKVI